MVILLRGLLCALALNIAGAGHTVEDVAGACTSWLEATSDPDCPGDPADCPPGCPNCHGHGVAALPGRPESTVAVAPLARDESGDRSPRTETLPGPYPSGPFRPPQAA